MSQQPMWVKSMQSWADFHVKIFPSLANSQALWKETEADYGLSYFGLLAKLDPELFCWRTSQTSMFSEGQPLLLRLPQSGMTHSGRLYELPMWAHRTAVKDGSVYPTPVASDIANRQAPDNPHVTATGTLKIDEQKSHVRLSQKEKFWATPVKSDATVGGVIGKNDTFKRTKNGNLRKYNRNGISESLGLARSVKLEGWMTPNARDWKGSSSIQNGVPNQAGDEGINKGLALNADWVELLMGYPIGYTDIETENADEHEGFPSRPNSPQFDFEPSRLTDRKEHRVNRLKALGNAVVPQQVAPFAAIMKDILDKT